MPHRNRFQAAAHLLQQRAGELVPRIAEQHISRSLHAAICAKIQREEAEQQIREATKGSEEVN